MAATPVRRGSRVGATYSLPLATFGEEELDAVKTRLTMQPRASFSAPPPPFRAWSVTETELHVPRFYGLAQFGVPEFDDRVLGEAVTLSFEGSLTEVQQNATSAIFTKHVCPEGNGGAIITLPCGFGKTVWAVHAAAALGRKTCILVHKAVIRDQWKEAFERFCPGVRVGFVQGKTWQVEGCEVVIAMIMTLAKRAYHPSVMDCFGLVVADECHHMAAPIMHLAMRVFRARYILGLTATKERADGLTPLLHWSLGPEGFRHDRQNQLAKVSVALYTGGVRDMLTRDGKCLTAVMLNKLAVNAPRNAFIADRVALMRKSGRVILVFTHRLVQLDMLRTLLLARGVPDAEVGIFKSGMSDSVWQEQLARPVVICSYGMADEGVNKEEADTIVMATPKSAVEQCIGRAQRPCETKQGTLVLDVADDASVFARQRWKRQKFYKKQGYEVQVVSVAAHGADDGVWFT